MLVNAVSQSANLRENDFASSLTFGDSGSRKQIAASEERVANNGEEPGNRDEVCAIAIRQHLRKPTTHGICQESAP